MLFVSLFISVMDPIFSFFKFCHSFYSFAITFCHLVSNQLRCVENLLNVYHGNIYCSLCITQHLHIANIFQFCDASDSFSAKNKSNKNTTWHAYNNILSLLIWTGENDGICTDKNCIQSLGVWCFVVCLFFDVFKRWQSIPNISLLMFYSLRMK